MYKTTFSKLILVWLSILSMHFLNVPQCMYICHSGIYFCCTRVFIFLNATNLHLPCPFKDMEEVWLSDYSLLVLTDAH
jgi:hypothetical protein